MAEAIKGMASLMAKLDALGGNVQKALEMAVKRTTLKAQGDAIAFVPVRTGNLLQGLKIKFEQEGSKYVGTVYDNVEYAIFQELGTKNMNAQPYMMPALNANRSTFELEAKYELLKAIQRKGG